MDENKKDQPQNEDHDSIFDENNLSENDFNTPEEYKEINRKSSDLPDALFEEITTPMENEDESEDDGLDEEPPQKSGALWIKLLVALLFLLVVFVGWSLTPAGESEESKNFIVHKDQGAYAIADKLEDDGLIRNAFVFKTIYKVLHNGETMQVGSYNLAPSMSAMTIMNNLISGQGKTYVVITIPEGYTVDQIADLIEEKGLGNASEFKDYAGKLLNPFLAEEDVSADVTYGIEGYLFPDTYHLYLEKPIEEELIESMLNNFDKKTQDLRENLPEDMTLQEWVILSSLVEREVRKKDEQELVASIFWKRLHIFMPLQSCASIQYILGEQKLELTIADTQIPSPYNTYQNSGLPPGPVSNPGLEALKASSFPKDTNILFFVAKPDGGHIFSETYEEHLAAIDQVDQL